MMVIRVAAVGLILDLPLKAVKRTALRSGWQNQSLAFNRPYLGVILRL